MKTTRITEAKTTLIRRDVTGMRGGFGFQRMCVLVHMRVPLEEWLWFILTKSMLDLVKPVLSSSGSEKIAREKKSKLNKRSWWSLIK